MKGKVSIILAAGLVVGLFALNTPAPAQDQQSQLFVVWDVIVYPSRFMEFEAPNKAFVALLAKHNCPFPMTTYRTDDYHYYFLVPIADLAGLEKVFNYFSKLSETAGKEYEVLHKSVAGTYESETLGVVSLRLDLSYNPERPRIKPEEMNFVWWNYYYIKSGKEEEGEAIAREWQALYGSNKITDSFNVYQYMIGSDIPAMVAAGGAKSAADFYSNEAKNLKKMGEEYQALAKRTMDLCRKFEHRTGTILRELSYTPKEE